MIEDLETSDIVITIDLDYFYWPPMRSISGTPLDGSKAERLAVNASHHRWMDDDGLRSLVHYVRELRTRVRLELVEQHHQVLRCIESAIKSGALSAPATLINFDAHSDLSYADSSDLSKASCLSGESLIEAASEATWVWFAFAKGWIGCYIWMKPDPDFLRFEIPDLPRSLVNTNDRHVLDAVKEMSLFPSPSWVDVLYDGRCPELLSRAYQSLEANVLGRNVLIRVRRYDIGGLPDPSRVASFSLSSSPHYTPAKADDLRDELLSMSDPAQCEKRPDGGLSVGV